VAGVLLFHHAQGLTAGCLALAGEIRAAGHVVRAPDLYEGACFRELAEGVAYAEELGFEMILDRARRAAVGLPNDVIYVGLSLGVMPAQMLAQTRAGARGAVLIHSCVPPSEFSSRWPPGLPVQIHTKDEDEWGDADVARQLAESTDRAELFLYPGSRHLFTDNSLSDYEPDSAALVTQRLLAFIAELDQRSGLS
jgi:dienelactone hydrolase